MMESSASIYAKKKELEFLMPTLLDRQIRY